MCLMTVVHVLDALESYSCSQGRNGEREGKKEVEKEGLTFEEKAEKQLFSTLGYHKIEVKEQIPWAVEKNT